MSFVPWDPSDDLPMAQLLRTAGWGPALVGRCQEAYDALTAAVAEVEVELEEVRGAAIE